jgi:hypothetical protein
LNAAALQNLALFIVRLPFQLDPNFIPGPDQTRSLIRQKPADVTLAANRDVG